MSIERLTFFTIVGRPAVTCDPACGALADFLDGNLQGMFDSIERTLQEIQDVRSGKSEKKESSGNACSIRITKDEVFIRNDWIPEDQIPPVRISLDTLERAVREWKSFLERWQAAEGKGTTPPEYSFSVNTLNEP